MNTIVDVDIEKRKLKRRKSRLSNVSVQEISLVNSAANNRTFLLWKSKEAAEAGESLDINDPEVMQTLEEEWEAMSPEERTEVEEEVTEELKKLDSMLTLTLMEADYNKLRKTDVGLCRMLKEFPEAINWNIAKGFSLKESFKLKKTEYLSHNGKYCFDLNDQKWHPVKR